MVNEVNGLSNEMLPSQTATGNGWLLAYRQHDDYPGLAQGKWEIYAKRNVIDNLWKVISLATEERFLGSFSKVSTIALANTVQTEVHVICVYTYDANDYKDIMRVRTALRELGITQRICYDTWNDQQQITLYQE